MVLIFNVQCVFLTFRTREDCLRLFIKVLVFILCQKSDNFLSFFGM